MVRATPHWHCATVGPANPLGVVRPTITPNKDWSRDRAKAELLPLIERFQGRVRYQDPQGGLWEPAKW